MAFLGSVINNPPLDAGEKTREMAGVCTHAADCVDWLRKQGVGLDQWAMPRRRRTPEEQARADQATKIAISALDNARQTDAPPAVINRLEQQIEARQTATEPPYPL